MNQLLYLLNIMHPNLSLNNNNNVVQNTMHRKRPVPRGIRRSSILNSVKLQPFNKTKRNQSSYAYQKRRNNMKTIRNSIALQRGLRIEEKRLEEKRLEREGVERRKQAFKAKQQLAKNKTLFGSTM